MLVERIVWRPSQSCDRPRNNNADGPLFWQATAISWSYVIANYSDTRDLCSCKQQQSQWLYVRASNNKANGYVSLQTTIMPSRSTVATLITAPSYTWCQGTECASGPCLMLSMAAVDAATYFISQQVARLMARSLIAQLPAEVRCKYARKKGRLLQMPNPRTVQLLWHNGYETLALRLIAE